MATFVVHIASKASRHIRCQLQGCMFTCLVSILKGALTVPILEDPSVAAVKQCEHLVLAVKGPTQCIFFECSHMADIWL